MNIHYFAYGSNMCTRRLRQRVPSARPLCSARLAGHQLCFHKRSTADGSGKGDAQATNRAEDIVWGIVFKIKADEAGRLDEAEGLGKGYEKKTVSVVDTTGQPHDCYMYVASDTHKNSDLRPYSWYLRFVLEGARQHNLPSYYITMIEAVEATEDLDRDRDASNREIQCDGGSESPEGVR